MQVALQNLFARCLMNVMSHRIFGFPWYDSVTAETERQSPGLWCDVR